MADASVVVDALVVAGPAGDDARAALATVEVLIAPAILGAEVTSALRTMAAAARISPGRARAALRALQQLHTQQHAFEPFAARVWELRDNITPYDAWYVALAEELDMPLVTADERLRVAPGPRCERITPAVGTQR